MLHIPLGGLEIRMLQFQDERERRSYCELIIIQKHKIRYSNISHIGYEF